MVFLLGDVWAQPGPLNLAALLPIGLALVWAVYLVYGRRPEARDDALKRALIIGGWTMVLAGLLGAGVGMTGPFGVIIAPAIVLTVLAAVNRFRHQEQNTLYWALATAARRGIPLHEMARGFADERQDELGGRTRLLAEALEAGAPLEPALRHAKLVQSDDALVAARVAEPIGALAPALKQTAEGDLRLHRQLDEVRMQLFYLSLVFLVGCVIMAFVQIKITPVFREMFEEFELELPAPTVAFFQVSQALGNTFPLWGPWLPIIILGSLVAATLAYVGWLPRNTPLVARLGVRIDRARVLRMLALAVEREAPLLKTMALLARGYPRHYFRWRIQRAVERMNDGQGWIEALQSSKVVSAADAAVLESAERAGNLTWALREMADSNIRRLIYRMQAWTNILWPVVLVIFGAAVLFYATAMFLPLVRLISGLS